jgi:DNA-binding NarL/FixJ family response regulator
VQLINRQTDMVCCGEVSSAAAARQAIAQKQPELILLDLRLGASDGLELIKSLKTEFPKLLILVLSQYDESLYAERALRAGAGGYLMKEEASEEVVNAIRMVLSGQLYISRKMAALVLHKVLQNPPKSGDVGVESLTDRELQVFQLIGAALSTQEIAKKLGLSFKTIETYRENIKHKLNLRTAAELVQAATGWVQNTGQPDKPDNLRAPPGSGVNP